MQVRNIRATVRNLSALAFVAAAGAANAAVDVTASTTEIGEVKTAAIAVGIAVFSVALGIKLYKWLKGAL